VHFIPIANRLSRLPGSPDTDHFYLKNKTKTNFHTLTNLLILNTHTVTPK